jgi:hypothetical protein
MSGEVFMLLLTLAAVHPGIQTGKPDGNTGLILMEQPPGEYAYVISTEGVFRLEKSRPQRAPKSFHPAFVFSSESKFKLLSKVVEHEGVTVTSADASTIHVRYSDGFLVHKGVAKTLRVIPEVEAASSFIVGAASNEYLVVRWRGDSTGCMFGFTLFHIEDELLKEVSSNAYGCDR